MFVAFHFRVQFLAGEPKNIVSLLGPWTCFNFALGETSRLATTSTFFCTFVWDLGWTLCPVDRSISQDLHVLWFQIDGCRYLTYLPAAGLFSSVLGAACVRGVGLIGWSPLIERDANGKSAPSESVIWGEGML